MQIAYVAYERLDPSVKDKLRLNPDYSKWTAGTPDEATARTWFRETPSMQAGLSIVNPAISIQSHHDILIEESQVV